MASREEYIVGKMSEAIKEYVNRYGVVTAALMLELKTRTEQWSEEYDEKHTFVPGSTSDLKERVSSF